jgi:hypothetical protein
MKKTKTEVKDELLSHCVNKQKLDIVKKCLLEVKNGNPDTDGAPFKLYTKFKESLKSDELVMEMYKGLGGLVK